MSVKTITNSIFSMFVWLTLCHFVNSADLDQLASNISHLIRN